MVQRRTFWLSSLCALAFPMAALAHGGAHQATHGSELQPTARPSFALTTQHMNTHLTRELGDGCRYEVAASGAYRTRDVTGESLRSPLRDVDITAQTTLTCRGQLVRRDQHHLVFPRMASAEELLTLLHERFATRVPNSSCTWAPVFDVNGGVLEAQSLVSSCSPAQEHAALIPYGTRPFAIGGGPRMINGRITNPYLDRTQPLPLEPIAPPYPPLDYGTPRAAPGNTNK